MKMKAENEKTKKEKCRQAIESVMAKVHTKTGQTAMETLYATLPFYMEYETKYEKKEKYGDIVKWLEERKETLSSADHPQKDTCWYLMTLLDVIDYMSFEIYEQYRKLQDIFKETLRDVLKETDNGSVLSAPEKAMTAYCILKACNMGIVLKEKYADAGMRLMECLAEEGYDASAKAREAEILMLAYGQYLKLQKEL